MIIKRTIKFSLQTQRNAESRLRMRVSYDGKRLNFQTGIILDKNNWDDAQQRVILFNSSAALANDLNYKLSLMLVNMDSIFRDFELRNVMPTTAELRYAYKYQNTLYVVKQKCTTANVVIYSDISLFYYQKFFFVVIVQIYFFINNYN